MATETSGRAVRSLRQPGDVTPGSVIVVGDVAFAVLGEPFLGMRGTGVFDQPELFWRARARQVDAAHADVTYVTWSPNEPVTVYERSSPEGDADGA